ncbi:hypothetical protein B0T14DRAFT_492609 [Immersiella caudata]|uniref:Pentatricopeptide repeat domain-containing protein n=1 Tax=Immersiella caudata TaxID=314043 RepID=A0AA40C5T8_9PEZI|nr:hypothetical protein B0T14DRAFT_492609 [Immersiella caudata]
MPGLWSTAARCRGCYLYSWIRSVHTLSCRVTSAAPVLRKAHPGNIFGARYASLATSTIAALDPAQGGERIQDLERELWEKDVVKLLELSGASDLAYVVANSSFNLDYREKTPYGVLEDIATRDVPLSLRQQESSPPPPRSYLDPYDDAQLHDREDLRTCERLVRREGRERDFCWTSFADPRFPERLPNTAVAVADALLERVYAGNDRRRLSPDSGFNAIRMLKSDGYPRYKRMEIYSIFNEVKTTHLHVKDLIRKARRGLKAVRRERARLRARLTVLSRLLKRREEKALRLAKDLLGTLKARLRDKRDPIQAPAKEFLEQIFEARDRLNEANDNVFAEWDSIRRERSVARLCFNILVSEYPPGVNNYNTLLLGLTKVGEHDLAQIIADHALGWSNRRKLEPMLHCLLTHYRRKGNYIEYLNLLRQFTGHHDGAVVLRPRPIDALRESWGYQAWAEDYAVGIRDGFVLERIRLEHYHLDAIIGGLLDFGNTYGAARFVLACQSDGIEIHPRIRYRLLSMCIKAMDLKLARKLVGFFLSDRDARWEFFDWRNNPSWAPWNYEIYKSANKITASRFWGDRLRALLSIACGPPLPTGDAPKARGRANALPRMRDRVRYLGVLAWTMWTEQHLSRVDRHLRNILSTLSSAEVDCQQLSKVTDSMAEELQFLHRQRWRNERARMAGQRKWLGWELNKSFHAVQGLRSQMMGILGNSFWVEPGLLDQAPDKTMGLLLTEMREPDSRSSHVSRCIKQCASADLEHREILLRFLGILTPPAQQHTIWEEMRGKSNEELFAAVSGRLAGRKAGEVSNCSGWVQSIMARLKSGAQALGL